ncbi:hypothetical protein CEXT_159321 [Caerostris extrusa]|uniref:Uncharacterized protein n=1 Tax=Caerostris extrusa TaxID=172846 RepID=A0AAV4NXM6_CAEEX|nr:hypothetical protein CEXT_159321 [Caerostris extrusa]
MFLLHETWQHFVLSFNRYRGSAFLTCDYHFILLDGVSFSRYISNFTRPCRIFCAVVRARVSAKSPFPAACDYSSSCWTVCHIFWYGVSLHETACRIFLCSCPAESYRRPFLRVYPHPAGR